MAMRVFRNTLWSVQHTTTDQVIADCPLPAECKQNNFWGEMHLVSDEGDLQDVDEVSIYGMSGWVIPVTDPDSALDVNTLWDALVPKDQDVASGAFDLDVNTVVTDQWMEYGEINLDRVLDMSNLQDENNWYRYKKMLSFAQSPLGFIAGSPDTFYATDVKKIRSGKKVEAEVMSWSMLGFTLADLGDIDTARLTLPSEKGWMQIKYIDIVLEQAWMFLVGLVETGAETPYEDAALLIQEMIEPEPIDTGTRLNKFNANVTCLSTFDITVPGRREVKVLSGAAA